MRFVAGRGAVAELLLAGALREGWSEAEVCAEELPLRGRPCMEYNATASGSSCELANPAQVRQIASQTGDLLRQMRFVAGRVAGWEAHREAAGRGPGRRYWS